MALQGRNREPVGDRSLDKWESIGFGGFGHVYKARHKDWGFDVAIKILHGVCPFVALCDEAHHMDQAACEFVLRCYGVYQGRPPGTETSVQHGLVMDFMERGSVESLQRDLSGPPPWPLVFRLAHQVALGMNFLHLHNLMHHDLKPSNVLLNIDLNAKLADFGLSRVSTSVLLGSRESAGVMGGSYKYMPPEAFDASYQPVRAFDRYSYGILLWSIVTGKEPYPRAAYELVELCICRGDRPSCEDTDHMKVQGLEELIVLMKRCWDGSPSKRPTFKECLEITENLFSKHKKEIHEAVHHVSTTLETSNQSNTVTSRVPLQTAEPSKLNDIVDHGTFRKTQTSSIQESISTKRMTDTEKARFVDDNRAKLILSVTDVMSITEELGDMVRPDASSYLQAKATNAEKMRVLYNTSLLSGGVVVKAAFYDILKNHHPQLVETLGRISSYLNDRL